MKIHDNLLKFMKILKSMKIYGYICLEERRSVIFYIPKKETPHISVLQKEIHRVNKENGN